MTKVYRIEREDGVGPYVVDPTIPTFPWTDDSDPNRPAPGEDGLEEAWRKANNRLRFGFKTCKQLRAWFDDQRRKWLGKHGFYITTYEAKQVYSGGHQVAFIPDHRISKKEITP